MRRVALQVFRQSRRPVLRKLANRRRPILFDPNYALGTRHLSSRRASVSLQSSMHVRNLSVALLSTAVAGGAYWAYRGGSTKAGDAGSVSLAGEQLRSSSTSSGESDPTKRVLIYDQNNLYTGVLTGPLSKETDDYGRKVHEMLTPDQVTSKLRKNEESWLVNRGQGVVRYDTVQIPSNDPIEDDHAEKIIEVPMDVVGTKGAESSNSSDWMFWGVFDGHSGWVTSARLRQALIAFVARELNTTYKSAIADPSVPSSPFPSAESIDQAIKKGFLKLDHEICHASVSKVTKAQSKRVAAELLAPALSGSCALLSFYDSRSKMLRVACTGDSRAVLGRRSPTSGKWTAKALSTDQTGQNPDEIVRMRGEHPGEPDVIRNGRVLGGLEPTRAFGDAIYKWSLETQKKIKESYFGRSASALLRTPPYVTAEPVVTTTKVKPEAGDFVVMATDGLWEMLTNEEVVGLVGQWLEVQAKEKNLGGAAPSGTQASWLKSWFSANQKQGLPVEGAPTEKEVGGQRAPIRQQQWGVKAKVDERFVVQDKNAATHLVRNALGGKDQDMLCALLTLPSPYSRRYRDDLTVEVIFFGEGENSGDVRLNEEASASAVEAKPKL